MARPRILVLYYSQTGQLRQILDSTLRDVASGADITYGVIEPAKPWPFPWNAWNFFDAMPESVVREPAPVMPLHESVTKGQYDLIVLGWQPWFLHPSQPVTAFMQSSDAALLKGKPVVTVIGSRNMWLNAGEKIKEDFQRLGARHVGNIVLTDTNTNLISLLTIIRWSFSGKREGGRWLPQAGVQDKDILAAARFGRPILEAAQELAEMADGLRSAQDERSLPPKVEGLHDQLLRLGGIDLDTGLVLLEQRGIKNFRFWAKYIRQKGGPGAPERKGRVTQFKRLLLTAIFVLSPISSLTAFIQRNLQRKRLLRDVDYFKGLAYESGRI
jgi:hypothetical protein